MTDGDEIDDDEISDLLAALTLRNRDAVQLAVLASLGARLEPEAVRALRLKSLPNADVSAELDLWSSDLVDARGATGITLRRDALKALRARLIESGSLESAHQVLRDLHPVATSPFVAFEESVTYAALAGHPAEVEDQLHQVTASILAARDSELTRFDNLVAGVGAVWPRLPGSVRNSVAAWELAFVAGVATDKPVPALDQLQIVPSLLRGAARENIAVSRDEDRVTFSHVAAVQPLQVPQSHTLILLLTWDSGRRETVIVPHQGSIAAPHRGEAAFRAATLAGDVYDIAVASASGATVASAAAMDLAAACVWLETGRRGQRAIGFKVRSHVVATSGTLARQVTAIQLEDERRRVTAITESGTCAIIEHNLPSQLPIARLAAADVLDSLPADASCWIGAPDDAIASTISQRRLSTPRTDLEGAPVATADGVIGFVRAGSVVSARDIATAILGRDSAAPMRFASWIQRWDIAWGHGDSELNALALEVADKSTVDMLDELDAAFASGDRAQRGIGLGILLGHPEPRFLGLVLRVIDEPTHRQEQLAAWRAAERMIPDLGPTQRRRLAAKLGSLADEDPRFADRLREALEGTDPLKYLRPAAPTILELSRIASQLDKEFRRSRIVQIIGGTAAQRSAVVRAYLERRRSRTPVFAWTFVRDEPGGSAEAFQRAGRHAFGNAETPDEQLLVLDAADCADGPVQLDIELRQSKRALLLVTAQRARTLSEPSSTIDVSTLPRRDAVLRLVRKLTEDAASVTVTDLGPDAVLLIALALSDDEAASPVRDWLACPCKTHARAASRFSWFEQIVHGDSDERLQTLRALWSSAGRRGFAEWVAAVTNALLGTDKDATTEWAIAFARPLDEDARGRVIRALAERGANRPRFAEGWRIATMWSPQHAYRAFVGTWREGQREIAEHQAAWIAELNAFPDRGDGLKGQFGRIPERDGCAVTAKVTPDGVDWYRVDLLVAGAALEGTVTFHLHDSFSERVQHVPTRQGRARLRLRAWGSFTVGVEAHDGTTRLEFDLGLVPAIPAGFADDTPTRDGLDAGVAAYGLEIPLTKGTRFTYRDPRRGATLDIDVVEVYERTDTTAACLRHQSDSPVIELLVRRGRGTYYRIAFDEALRRRCENADDPLDNLVRDRDLDFRLPARPRTAVPGSGTPEVRCESIEQRRVHGIRGIRDRDTIVYTFRNRRCSRLQVVPKVGIVGFLQGDQAWELVAVARRKAEDAATRTRKARPDERQMKAAAKASSTKAKVMKTDAARANSTKAAMNADDGKARPMKAAHPSPTKARPMKTSPTKTVPVAARKMSATRKRKRK